MVYKYDYAVTEKKGGPEGGPALLDFDEVEGVPVHLKTRSRRVLALIFTAVMCMIASGPVASFPTLEPLLIDSGLFPVDTEVQLETCYNIMMAVMFASSLITGLLYDRQGGRFCATLGAFLAATGLFGMSVACKFPTDLSGLMYISYPTAVLGGMMNSYGLYTFIWLLPDNQNFISSVGSGCQALSDMIALIAVWLHHYHNYSIAYFFLLVCFASVVSGIVCYLVIPSHHDTMIFAAKALGSTIDVIAPQLVGGEVRNNADFFEPERKTILKAWRVMKRYPIPNAIIIIFSTAYVLSIYYPTMVMYPYYTELFGKSTAIHLVNVYAIVYGLGGFAANLVGGFLCDYIGVTDFVLFVSFGSFISTCLLPTPTVSAQFVAQIVMTLGASLYFVIVNRFSMLYAKPDIFGTLSGLQFTFVAIGMGIVLQLSSFYFHHTEAKDAEQYQFIFMLYGTLACLMGMVQYTWWTHNPPPKVGAMDDDSDLDTPNRQPNEDPLRMVYNTTSNGTHAANMDL